MAVWVREVACHFMYILYIAFCKHQITQIGYCINRNSITADTLNKDNITFIIYLIICLFVLRHDDILKPCFANLRIPIARQLRLHNILK